MMYEDGGSVGTTATNGPDLNIDKLRESLKRIQQKLELNSNYSKYSASYGFDDKFRFCGLDLYEAPAPRQKIEVRDIKLSDGTSILSEEFRAEMNAWLAQEFGYREDIYKNKAYFLGNYGVVMNRQMINMIRNTSI